MKNSAKIYRLPASAVHIGMFFPAFWTGPSEQAHSLALVLSTTLGPITVEFPDRIVSYSNRTAELIESEQMTGANT